MNDKIFLSSGAKPFTLGSGDEGLMIDICVEELNKILKENEDSDILRPFTRRSENRVYHNIRIFAIPKKHDNDHYHTHYLEVAKVIKKRPE